uniref:Uncharacterized protein n=1 Tax=uncultured Desulfobacterium sp. TaxID=201089 RepID=E1YKE3_9BACT|nr:unknown protein [uncultured Desulfobacterium sp.]
MTMRAYRRFEHFGFPLLCIFCFIMLEISGTWLYPCPLD